MGCEGCEGPVFIDENYSIDWLRFPVVGLRPAENKKGNGSPVPFFVLSCSVLLAGLIRLEVQVGGDGGAFFNDLIDRYTRETEFRFAAAPEVVAGAVRVGGIAKASCISVVWVQVVG